MYGLRVGGVPLSSLLPWGNLEVQWTWGAGGGGLKQVTWSAFVPDSFADPRLRPGALVELTLGSFPVGLATILEPGRVEQGLSFTALGIRSEGDAAALDGSGNSSSVADEAIDAAITNGWVHWKRPVSITTNPLKSSSTMQGINSLTTVLDSLADELGQRYSFDGFANITMAPDVTTPKWRLIPGVANLTPTRDVYASTLIGRYINGSGTYTTLIVTDPMAEAMWGHKEAIIDMTAYGQISLGRATNRLNGILAKGRAKLTMAERIEVSKYQLTTADGRPAPLSLVRGGDMVRIPVTGALATYARAQYVDLILGEVYDPVNGETITIAPADMAARTLTDVLRKIAPRAQFVT